MSSKAIVIITSVLQGAGILLLLAAAFDVTALADNTIIFLALLCFIVSGVIRRIAAGCCCK